ncbi:transcriptional regulator [Rhizobium rhizosphaerae]|uniref:Transcriptional regulator n=1 Tax=Xaviernesmea rhizosphaerae TaxID=1672749 RepID=A0ABX3PFV4_9HYPH|nr:AraC family transcriptional regulator [Xaviernesmea rhizosphaerae]OQP87380.1 transcriptional regulator [Xaviernesmea rhizosphaerae]
MKIASQTIDFSHHRRVDTRAIDEAREAIGRIFCPHFLDVTDPARARFHARHAVADGPGYSVNLVSYGAEVEIDPGELSRFFLLQLPLKGHARVRCGTAMVEAAAGRRASLLSPTLATRMRWMEGCEKLIVLIERAAVERHAAAFDGGRDGPVEFSPEIDLTAPVGRAALQHAGLMAAAAVSPSPLPEAYRLLLRDGLISLLFNGLGHNRSAPSPRPGTVDAPAPVRRAQAFIEAHAAHPITTAEIATAAGLSLRSLQDAFRKARGMTLIEALQAARLEKLRAKLLRPEEALTVADAVFDCGLGHLGRAAAAYRNRYGETPSQTLRRGLPQAGHGVRT